MKIPRRVRRDVLEALTEGEVVIDMDRFWDVVIRMIELRGMLEEDAVMKLVTKLCSRYKTWNLRGVENNLRFRDLGPVA